jgi:hypothetical protein
MTSRGVAHNDLVGLLHPQVPQIAVAALSHRPRIRPCADARCQQAAAMVRTGG